MIMELDQVCVENSFNNNYATKVRSIRLEDINKITKFDVEQEITDYGATYKYKLEENGDIQYIKNNEDPKTVQSGMWAGRFILPDGNNTTLGNTWSREFKVTWSGGDKVSVYNQALGNIIGSTPFWLATNFEDPYDSGFRVGLIGCTGGSITTMGFHSETGSQSKNSTFGVRSVVYLKPEVKLQQAGAPIDWRIVLE